MEPEIIGLFEGTGALTMATRAVLGGRLIAYSEIEPAACRVLAHHNPGVPNLGDVTGIDWSTVERDARRQRILTGGFPCQDVSLAGRRAGMRPETRSGLWAHMAYAIGGLRPDLVIIENVRGLLSADAVFDLELCPWCMGDGRGRHLRALGAVLGSLAELGYDARWLGLPASDVGAPHERFRIFVIAWPVADPDGIEPERGGVAGVMGGAPPAEPGEARQRERAGDTAGDRSEDAPDPERDGWAGRDPRGTGGPQRPEESRPTTTGCCAPAADPHDIGPVRSGGTRRGRGGPEDDGLAAPDSPSNRWHEGRAAPARLIGGSDAALGGLPALAWGEYELAIRRWERVLGRAAPAPTQPGAAWLTMVTRRRARLDRRPAGMRGSLAPRPQLSPRFVEWMMGLPEGHVTAVPGLSRNEQLKLLGNGVVPQQAEAALRRLLSIDAAA